MQDKVIKLTDKNGKMIEKGDILIDRKFNNSLPKDEFSPKLPKLIVRDDFTILLTGMDDIVPISEIFCKDGTTPCEVIGNVIKNPEFEYMDVDEIELLEGGE